ncbi:MAG: hypothetical protein GX488_02785 [Clostridiales bacterium]|nr:hypothetical protein [Clostridiales bacterium]
MKKRLIYGFAAAVVILVAAVIIKLCTPSGTSHNINLPSPVGEDSSGLENSGIKRVEVTADTVQSALQTLKRAENFSRTYKIKDYWDSGESESTLNMWQKGENIRISISQKNTVKNILIRGNDLYIWYSGSSDVFSAKLTESSAAAEADRFSRLVTYEEILNIPRENILSAGYAEQAGQPCIFAEYKSGDLGYVNQIYVSVDSGLLVSLNRYDGNKLIYSMVSVSTELSTPSEDVFEIPSTGKA